MFNINLSSLSFKFSGIGGGGTRKGKESLHDGLMVLIEAPNPLLPFVVSVVKIQPISIDLEWLECSWVQKNNNNKTWHSES